VAPFRLNHDELRHELAWRLMQNSPVTLYRRHEVFGEDLRELETIGFVVARFDCAEWATEDALHAALKRGLRLRDYTGANFDALDDSLADIDVPEHTGLMVALDHVDRSPRSEVLLDVLAGASRWWLLFGRIFGVLARVDDPRYQAPAVGAMRPSWNGREWLDSDRTT
jgi:RNAse (barnase) inhibitor barstar